MGLEGDGRYERPRAIAGARRVRSTLTVMRFGVRPHVSQRQCQPMGLDVDGRSSSSGNIVSVTDREVNGNESRRQGDGPRGHRSRLSAVTGVGGHQTDEPRR